MDSFILLAVTGKPVAHSKSPQIQNAALAEAGIEGVYVRLAANSAQDAIDSAKDIGISGLNITSPFKEDFVRLADELSIEAKEIGAVNTVTIKNGKICGHNTDLQGVIGGLENNNTKINDRTAVILGAGGAAKAAVYALTSKGAEVSIANRTVSKAKAIAQKFGCEFSDVKGIEFENRMKKADIVVSTLSTVEKVIDTTLLKSNMTLFDAVYGKETELTKNAKKAGCRIINGQEWLLFSGERAFEIFTGKKVSIEVMRNALQMEPHRMTKANIALIGLVGSGKSTVSDELEKISKARVIHIDEEIEKNKGMTIREIFEKEGEPAFRALEGKMVAKAAKQRRKIISCGGGAVLDPKNIALIKGSSEIVWINAKISTIIERIGDNAKRPLLNVENKEEKMGQMLRERLPSYAKCSDLVICSDNKEPQEIAMRIYEEFESILGGKHE